MSCILPDVSGRDRVTLLGEDRRVARVEHACGECGRAIRPGEQYEAARWVQDGEFGHHETCSVCLDLRDKLFCEEWVYGEILFDLREYISDRDGEMPLDWLDRLSPEARAVVVGMVDDYLEEVEK